MRIAPPRNRAGGAIRPIAAGLWQAGELPVDAEVVCPQGLTAIGPSFLADFLPEARRLHVRKRSEEPAMVSSAPGPRGPHEEV